MSNAPSLALGVLLYTEQLCSFAAWTDLIFMDPPRALCIHPPDFDWQDCLQAVSMKTPERLKLAQQAPPTRVWL